MVNAVSDNRTRVHLSHLIFKSCLVGLGTATVLVPFAVHILPAAQLGVPTAAVILLVFAYFRARLSYSASALIPQVNFRKGLSS